MAGREILTEYARHLREVAGPLQRALTAIEQLRQFERKAEAAGINLPLQAPEIGELRSFGQQCAEAIGDYTATLEAPDHHAVRKAQRAEKFSR